MGEYTDVLSYDKIPDGYKVLAVLNGNRLLLKKKNWLERLLKL